MREYRLFLIGVVEDFISGMDLTKFLNDRKTQKAV